MGYDPQTAKVIEAHPSYAMSFGSALAGITMLESDDVSDAVVWLASDSSRTVTGTQLTLDMGATKM
jgi:enoyl-[acyl-carrier-protein] reductase (NADH)